MKYLKNGLLHRLDGPAFKSMDGTSWWYRNGWLHRLDGPAEIRIDRNNQWYLLSVRLKKIEFNSWIKRIEKVIRKKA